MKTLQNYMWTVVLITLLVITSNGFSQEGPYGGGSGYSNIIDVNQADFIITTNDYYVLKSTLNSANSGDIIYIMDNLEIAVPDIFDPLVVPAGVTLASGRGINNSLGALIYLEFEINDYNYMTSIIKPQNNSRITGLRFRGPNGNPRYNYSRNYARQYGYYGFDNTIFSKYNDEKSNAILIYQSDNIIIDNCEIYNFSNAGIVCDGGTNLNPIISYIHHNYIHNTQFWGVGYGISSSKNSNPKIDHNIFDYYRHGVTGGHLEKVNYEVKNNLFLKNGCSTAVDMHPSYGVIPCITGVAGNKLLIENNTFLNNDVIQINGFSVTQCWGVGIDGSPVDNTSLIKDNFFINDSSVKAIYQYKHLNCDNSDPYTNITCAPNSVSHFNSYCLSSENTFNNTNDNIVYITFNTPNGWTGWKTVSPYNYNCPVTIADFNADHKSDLFRGDGTKWYYSNGGFSDWHWFNSSSYTVGADLIFGDFNNDDYADVLHPTGTQWLVVYGNSSSGWQVLNNYSGVGTKTSSDRIIPGNFNGAGGDDMLFRESNKYYISTNGTSNKTLFCTVPSYASIKGFFDFDGDGKCDVFYPYKNESANVWSFYFGKVINPTTTVTFTWFTQYDNNNQPPLSSMVYGQDYIFGDFDGNNTTDILVLNGVSWYVYYTNANINQCYWGYLGTSSYKANQNIYVGDFDGNGRSDILHLGDPSPYNLSYYSTQFSNNWIDILPFKKQGRFNDYSDNSSWIPAGLSGYFSTYLFYLNETTEIVATTCNDYTEFNPMLYLFQYNFEQHTKTLIAVSNSNIPCSYNITNSTIQQVLLHGLYFIVVNSNTLNKKFQLEVTPNDGLKKELTPKDYKVINEDKVEIYPNPIADVLNVKFLGSNPVSYNIFDYMGRLVKKGAIFDSESINVSNLDNGIYLIRLTNPDYSITKKIIINH